MKVGDTITIKTAKQVNEEFGVDGIPYGCNSIMRKMFGSTATISSIKPINGTIRGRGGYVITIDEDHDQYLWHEDMFVHENVVTEKVFDVLRGV